MAAVLELIIRGRDELSGPMGKAQVSLGSLVKAGAVAAVGFGGMEAAMMGAKSLFWLWAERGVFGRRSAAASAGGAARQAQVLLDQGGVPPRVE